MEIYILHLASKSLVTGPNLLQVSEVIFMSHTGRNEDYGGFMLMAWSDSQLDVNGIKSPPTPVECEDA